MDPTTNTDTPAEIPADAQDADDVRGSIVTPVTPSLASYVGGGPSLTARARGSSRQRQLLCTSSIVNLSTSPAPSFRSKTLLILPKWY